ncbi:hypothetical protein [Lysobacter gummosus]
MSVIGKPSKRQPGQGITKLRIEPSVCMSSVSLAYPWMKVGR